MGKSVIRYRELIIWNDIVKPFIDPDTSVMLLLK